MKKMRKTMASLCILLCFCMMITACGTGGEEQIQENPEEAASNQTGELSTKDGTEEEEDTVDESRSEKTEEDTEENTGEDSLEPEAGEDTAIANLSDAFYAVPLSEEIKDRITGVSYPNYEPYGISYDELRYVHVLHYDLNHEIKEGELICNQLIAEDLVEIFRELFEQEYPIERMCLVEEYNGDDETSMRDNNTSCFNYRVIAGSSSLSNHSFGLAIDINPLYNPYVSGGFIQPATGGAYADRSGEFPYKIDREDLCYQLFTEHGFTWGGDWSSPKDYQHFEYVR